MKTLKEALFSRKNIKSNPFGLTNADLIGDIKGFPMGVVVRMLEEQELHGNEPDVKVFQKSILTNKEHGGFTWDKTKDGLDFWRKVLYLEHWNEFFKRYPDYEMYNIS